MSVGGVTSIGLGMSLAAAAADAVYRKVYRAGRLEHIDGRCVGGKRMDHIGRDKPWPVEKQDRTNAKGIRGTVVYCVW